jgi:HK97 family phage portal protein
MGFLSGLRDLLGLGKSADLGDDPFSDDRFLGYPGAGTTAGVRVDDFSAMRHVGVMACVSILSGDIAKIPLGIYRRKANGGKEPAREHYLHKLLRQPNNWQTAFEWKEMMQSSLVMRGNAYSVAVRNGRGVPQYLVPIYPDRVALYEAPDGNWFYWVTRNGLHETAVLRDQGQLIPAEDMLHLRWLPTGHSLLGSSRLTMARESIGLSMGLEEHESRFVGQGARTGGVLQTDKAFASKEVREQMREEWKILMAGPRNSGATAILEQGLKWQPLGLSMVDSQFIESRNFQLRDLARAFDVPPHRLAIEGETEGPAMVQAAQGYLNGPISGYCERWKARLEIFFDLDGEDVFLDWDYNHFLKADMVTRYTAYRQATGGAWMSINEARELEGMPKVENGDDVLQPVNMAPLGWTPTDQSASGPGSDATGAPAQGGDGDPERDPAGDDPDNKT